MKQMMILMILMMSGAGFSYDQAYDLADPIAHKTDFLTLGRPSQGGCYTHLYPALSLEERQKCREFLLEKNYTHIYIYIYNEFDYRGPSFNFYEDPETYIERLKELLDAGLTPIVWLVPDDAPVMHRKPVAEIQGLLSSVIPKLDPYVGSYVLGLELDEYWGDSYVKPLGRHLRSLTDKKIGVHLLPGSVRFVENEWVDYLLFQYGFGKTAEQIYQITLEMKERTFGKPFVAAEYSLRDELVSIELGKAALEAGAVGFGNGGPVDLLEE